MKHQYYLGLAKKVSRKSDHHQYRMGCVITRGRMVLGTGFNMLKTHPKSPHTHKSIHAEFMAAINAGYDIKGATVYVFRQHKDGTWAMAKPCKDCWKFLMDLGVRNVIYSFEGSFRYEEMPEVSSSI